MQLKKLAQVMLVSCTILTLAACSSGKKYGAGSGMGGDMNGGGAQASGIGEGDNFGDSGSNANARGINKRTYYFDFNSNEIHQDDMSALAANADYLVAHPTVKVIVEGHTDPRGSREYNVALGERRADAVVDVLKSRGVNADQIRVVSYGAERLAVPGRSEQDFQLDRRAVIVYTQR